MEKILIIYLLIINVLTFLIFMIDKIKAKHSMWRVPEKTLFLLSFLGGALGALIGMKVCHHKTKKWYFRIFIPAFLVLQICLLLYLFICYF